MFRLFLKKKLLSGDEAATAEPPAGRTRNRRVFQRYAIDHKHLTLMNEQDILLIREISAKGFSTEVSQRGFERLAIGDVYDARIRYLGEIYALQARVAWKHDNFVGFEMVEADRDTLAFVRRLIRPIEIAVSLKTVDASFLKEAAHGKEWLHGDDESDLYIWRQQEGSDDVRAWQLAVGKTYVEWSENDGLTSGKISPVEGQEALLGANLQGLTHTRDEFIDETKKQFAIDVIMAVDHPLRDRLLDTLSG